MSDGRRDEKENHPRLAKSGHHFPEVAEDGKKLKIFTFFCRTIGQRIHNHQCESIQKQSKAILTNFHKIVRDDILRSLGVSVCKIS